MSKTIAITGVTGVQGTSVAKTFLNLPDWKVRGITRNPSGAAAQSLAEKGIRIFEGNLDDTSSLLPAFEGANVIFSNTDFFGHIIHALQHPDVLPAGSTAQEYAFDREVEQGVNIAEAAASPSVLSTLDRFVLSSLSDADKWSKGKYPHCYHNNTKVEMMRVISSKYPELGAKMSTVQIGHYVSQWKSFPALASQKQHDGSHVVQRPWSPDLRMPFVVAERDTGAFVKPLVVDPPTGTDLLGVSEYMTLPEWAKLWGRVTGVKASFKQVSYDEFFAGVPEPFSKELGETFQYVDEFGYTGGDPAVKDADQLGINIPVTSMEEYIRSEDWSSVL